MTFLLYIEHFIITVIVVVLCNIFVNKGKDAFLKVIVGVIKNLPGMDVIIENVLRNEATNFMKQVNLAPKKGEAKKPRVVIPKVGIPHDQLREELKDLQGKENQIEDGNIFAYMYTLPDDHFQIQKECFDRFEKAIGYSVDHDALVTEAHHAFLHENALNPMIFPSLRTMETEILSMSAAMLNGDEDACGFLTSGGTESILMAVKCYRDRAKKLFPHIKEPEIIAPITAHPVIEKAAHYFGLKITRTPIGPDHRADVKAMERAITSDTILLVGSAPQFCHGIVDDIEAISDLAVRKGLPVHVDGCFGGFMLPWVEKLGYEVPKWDFRCPGVMSISADIHKYGYTVKGSSVIVYRNADIRKYQIFVYAEWPGGLYGSPSMAGTRGGGNIAASWTSMRALGEDGFMRKAKELMDITNKLKEGINNIDGLCILGKPCMTGFSIGSNSPDVDILAVADAMEKRGWKMERQQNPFCLHCSILPHHAPVADKMLLHLKECAEECRDNKSLSKQGTAGVYGMMAKIPDKGLISDFIVEFFSEVYKCK
ncbi:uncharacterized protein LOC126827602 [Patella vulgata]|uniref:uncharacterized protein LOC126827602 n=1 Tax=Patella vulgata TaxID=6465 RepID=UPI00217F775E|nr:uncharacterized protein LOC126827602 [Patella vulgata]